MPSLLGLGLPCPGPAMPEHSFEELTMADDKIALMAHLYRRAGFGATREELEEAAAREYEDVVEDLLHPERFPEVDVDIMGRYFGWDVTSAGAAPWMYRMVNTKRPLQEKMALFWHHVFATAYSKSEHPVSLNRQIATFRRVGMRDLPTILMELSKDPAMIFWLDNNENHRGEPNENYGRELLELFSMGVGNYTEQDLKMAARAFTGWTFSQPIPLYPHGHYEASFVYDPEAHDDSEKSFLGENGRFDGEDIIEIVARQPAAPRFIARHLYNFFVADEAQVPAWSVEPPRDPDAIDAMTAAYFESGYEMRSVLRVLFNSDFFKNARQRKVKSPAELVSGVLKLVGTHRFPEPGFDAYAEATKVMGQELLNPPTVEGWHTGKEWIDGGTLNERVNFAVNEVAPDKPGVQSFIEGLMGGRSTLPADELVERSLELAGPFAAGEETRASLSRFAETGGDMSFATEEDAEVSTARATRMLQLVVASREYQMA